jgi:hypothetical protein
LANANLGRGTYKEGFANQRITFEKTPSEKVHLQCLKT